MKTRPFLFLDKKAPLHPLHVLSDPLISLPHPPFFLLFVANESAIDCAINPRIPEERTSSSACCCRGRRIDIFSESCVSGVNGGVPFYFHSDWVKLLTGWVSSHHTPEMSQHRRLERTYPTEGIHSSSLSHSPEGNVYRCSDCSQVFHTKTENAAHSRWHHSRRYSRLVQLGTGVANSALTSATTSTTVPMNISRHASQKDEDDLDTESRNDFDDLFIDGGGDGDGEMSGESLPGASSAGGSYGLSSSLAPTPTPPQTPPYLYGSRSPTRVNLKDIRAGGTGRDALRDGTGSSTTVSPVDNLNISEGDRLILELSNLPGCSRSIIDLVVQTIIPAAQHAAREGTAFFNNVSGYATLRRLRTDLAEADAMSFFSSTTVQGDVVAVDVKVRDEFSLYLSAEKQTLPSQLIYRSLSSVVIELLSNPSIFRSLSFQGSENSGTLSGFASGFEFASWFQSLPTSVAGAPPPNPLPLAVYSDATQIFQSRGGLSMHPIYASIPVATTSDKSSIVLVGFLPHLPPTDELTHMSDARKADARAALFEDAMDIVFRSLLPVAQQGLLVEFEKGWNQELDGYFEAFAETVSRDSVKYGINHTLPLDKRQLFFLPYLASLPGDLVEKLKYAGQKFSVETNCPCIDCYITSDELGVAPFASDDAIARQAARNHQLANRLHPTQLEDLLDIVTDSPRRARTGQSSLTAAERAEISLRPFPSPLHSLPPELGPGVYAALSMVDHLHVCLLGIGKLICTRMYALIVENERQRGGAAAQQRVEAAFALSMARISAFLNGGWKLNDPSRGNWTKALRGASPLRGEEWNAMVRYFLFVVGTDANVILDQAERTAFATLILRYLEFDQLTQLPSHTFTDVIDVHTAAHRLMLSFSKILPEETKRLKFHALSHAAATIVRFGSLAHQDTKLYELAHKFHTKPFARKHGARKAMPSSIHAAQRGLVPAVLREQRMMAVTAQEHTTTRSVARLVSRHKSTSMSSRQTPTRTRYSTTQPASTSRTSTLASLMGYCQQKGGGSSEGYQGLRVNLVADMVIGLLHSGGLAHYLETTQYLEDVLTSSRENLVAALEQNPAVFDRDKRDQLLPQAAHLSDLISRLLNLSFSEVKSAFLERGGGSRIHLKEESPPPTVQYLATHVIDDDEFEIREFGEVVRILHRNDLSWLLLRSFQPVHVSVNDDLFPIINPDTGCELVYRLSRQPVFRLIPIHATFPSLPVHIVEDSSFSSTRQEFARTLHPIYQELYDLLLAERDVEWDEIQVFHVNRWVYVDIRNEPLTT